MEKPRKNPTTIFFFFGFSNSINRLDIATFLKKINQINKWEKDPSCVFQSCKSL